MPALIDCTLPTLGRRPYHRKPAQRVGYVDPETLKERQSGTMRLHCQHHCYGRRDAIVPADLAAHCDQADARLRAEIRARVTAGRSLALARDWTALASPSDDPAPVAAT